MATTSTYSKPKRQTKRPRRLDDMWVKEEKETITHYVDDDRDEDWSEIASSGQESGADSGSSAHSSSLSLDVLAQVATETLRREPVRPKAKPKAKPAKKKRLLTARGVSSMETLTLEQIRMLSDTSLINMFAENKSDELRRIFTYTCFLMPDRCKANFSSFGNESRARQQVRVHLLGHIGELLQESCINSTDVNAKRFTAEPLHARHKRLAREKAVQQRVNKQRKPVPKPRTNNPPKGSSFTVIKSPNAQASSSGSGPSHTPSPSKRRVGGTTHKAKTVAPASSSGPNEHEQTIIDLLSRSQPFADHSYTTVFGKRYNQPPPGQESDEVVDDKNSNVQSNMTVAVRVNSSTMGKMNHVHVPVIRLGQLPHGQPTTEGETMLITESEIDSYGTKNNMTSRSAYPPMPKSDPAHKGKVELPEEDMLSSEDDTGPPLHVLPQRPRKKMKVGTSEQERKLALKYIRELRYKSRPNEAVTLVCKICRDKTFTATATLLYHYRSHAGIKPFVCLICNTTFTRQHSLNYHMLIHNNQSRFTCKECGRKFRHPSHFKEHLRRHTGETPFHCTDCPLRFKTRNTYKRHLRTRHNKMLTSSGIQVDYEGLVDQLDEDTDS